MSRFVFLDTEAYQPRLDRAIKSVGGHRYIETAELTIATWAEEYGPAHCLDFTDDTARYQWRGFRAMLNDPENIFWAWNSAFDRGMVNRWLRTTYGDEAVPRSRWRCAMSLSLTCGLPASLGESGKAFGLPADKAKIKEGARLIALFSKPTKAGKRRNSSTHPQDWARFLAYALRDTEAMRDIVQGLPHWVYPDDPRELEYWLLDQRANDRGIPVDLHLAQRVAEQIKKHSDRLNKEAGRIIAASGEEPGASVLQKVQFTRAWLAKQGVDTPDFRKATIAETLKRDDLPQDVREVLELRQASAKASTAKYRALLRATSDDGWLRGVMRYYGANRTGRDSAKLFQPQNLPSRGLLPADTCVNAFLNGNASRIFDDVLLAASSAVRSTILAPWGRKLVWGDLSGIEARIVPWLAYAEDILDVFREGRDVYVECAASILGKPLEAVSSWERLVYGKVPILALGFQGAVGAFLRMAANYGVTDLSESMVLGIVKGFRRDNPATVALWYDCERAAKNAMKAPGRIFRAGRLAFSLRRYKGREWLVMHLPSGRKLLYYRPRFEIVVHPDHGPREQICYDGTDQKTHRWGRQSIYGGKFVQNGTQALARDVMFAALPRLEAEGYKVLFRVHDEPVTLAPDDEHHTPERVRDILATVPEWAEGLPLAAKAFQDRRYHK